MTDIDLEAELVRETRRIARVEHQLRARRVPLHTTEERGTARWLEIHRARLEALQAALCTRWLETGR